MKHSDLQTMQQEKAKWISSSTENKLPFSEADEPNSSNISKRNEYTLFGQNDEYDHDAEMFIYSHR